MAEGNPTRRFVQLPASLCTRLDESEFREWLLADGVGGYAAGTVAGSVTRRYHGLLFTATQPPAGRTLLVHSVHERILVGDNEIKLDTNRWADGSVEPRGVERLVGFELEGRTPVWTWKVDGIRIQRRFALENGLLEIRWNLEGTSHPVHMHYSLLVSNRSHHALMHAGSATAQTVVDDDQTVISWPTPPEGGASIPLYIKADGTLMARGAWWTGFRLSEETARGFDDLDDAWQALDCSVVLPTEGDVSMHAALDPDLLVSGLDLVANARKRDEEIARAAGADEVESLDGRLAIAADQFIVKRTLPGGVSGTTILAGYPWFADWGRDTMISLPGLTIETDRHDEAISILETFAAHEQDGLIPNLFPEDGSRPLYNTVDASLFFLEAVRRWYEATRDENRLRGLWPTIQSIITHYSEGTLHGIGVDPADGLVHAGEPGLQLTWMDARVGNRVITPRMGKPVEINALWHAGLHSAAGFARALGEDPHSMEQQAEQVRASFDRFWNEDTGCLFDVLDGPGGDDPSIRPNQLFAVSLTPAVLESERARRVLDVVQRELLIPLGIRSLDQGSGQFVPHYEGSPADRDSAYHQGTAWPWLLQPWIAAQLAVNSKKARGFIDDVLKQATLHLQVAGLGSVSEIFDATAPFTPRGCFAQAWSVAAMLEVLAQTKKTKSQAEATAGER